MYKIETQSDWKSKKRDSSPRNLPIMPMYGSTHPRILPTSMYNTLPWCITHIERICRSSCHLLQLPPPPQPGNLQLHTIIHGHYSIPLLSILVIKHGVIMCCWCMGGHAMMKAHQLVIMTTHAQISTKYSMPYLITIIKWQWFFWEIWKTLFFKHNDLQFPRWSKKVNIKFTSQVQGFYLSDLQNKLYFCILNILIFHLVACACM